MTGAILALALTAWTPTDTKLELGFAGLVLTDASLTHYGLSRGLEERNPVLGSHPTPARLWGTVAVVLGAHAGITYLLPGDWRRAWQVGSIAIEFAVVAGNTALVLGGTW